MNFFNVHNSERSKKLALEVLSGSWIGEGAMAAEFERQLSARLGLVNPVTVNSGTAALHLALVIAGVGAGDEVIVPAQTFVATAMVVMQCGATPVFADIDPQTGNMDAQDLKKRITEKTRAIIPVHYGGMVCNLSEIYYAARGFDLSIIEDAAQALGATYAGMPIGSISRFTCFSFQATKHITTGDGGALCCLDENDAREALRRRWFGIDRQNTKTAEEGNREFDINEVGYKYHLNDLAAAVGLGNLEELEERLRRRREIAGIYREKLKNAPGVELLRLDEWQEPAYYIFTMLVEERLDFVRALRARCVPASVCMRRIDRNTLFGGMRDDLPGTEYFDEHQISIPCHEGLSDEDVEMVVGAIKEGW